MVPRNGVDRPGTAVANGVVYVGSSNHKIYAPKASTGAQLWSHATGAAVESSPAVANGVVYVGSLDHKVYALEASTGAALWSYTTEATVFSSPTMANGVVYVGSDDGTVYAFDLPGGLPSVAQPRIAQLQPDFSLGAA